MALAISVGCVDALGPEGVGASAGARVLGIAGIQRARILAATLEVAAERGAANVTVAYVVERSGVSRRTFYESFADLEECLDAAFEEALGQVAERVLPAYEAERGWSERMRAGLGALLLFLEERPSAGRMLLIDSSASGGRVLARREQVLAGLVAAVEDGRGERRSGSQPPPLTGEGVVGGVLSILARLIVRPRRESLVGMVGPLMGLIVTPYLGSAASRREIERPVEAARVAPGVAQRFVDPFKPAGLRLTYRTARVLLAIAEHPDASNRRIGELAEMRDQGQVSKLLGRLRRLGLIENTGLAPGQGAPNSWRLTGKGIQVQQSIRAYTGAKSHIDTTLGSREGTPK